MSLSYDELYRQAYNSILLASVVRIVNKTYRNASHQLLKRNDSYKLNKEQRRKEKTNKQ